MVEFSVNTDDFTNLVNGLAAVNEEAMLSFTERGIEANALDPANVFMVQAYIDSAHLQNYTPDNQQYGFSLPRMQQVISTAEDDELLISNDGPQFTFDTGGLTFNIASIGETLSADGIPTLTEGAKFRIPNHHLNTAITAADGIADHLRFVIKDKQFEVLAEGDLDDVRYTIHDNEFEFVGRDADCEALFSVQYFKEINKHLKKCLSKDTPIYISLDTDYPAIINAPIGDGVGELTFAVAPRLS